MKKAVLLFLPVLLVALTTCQSLQSAVQKPKVSFNRVEVAGISFTGIDLVVHVDVENPNSFSIPFPRIDWEIFINENSFLHGALPNDQSLRSRQKVTIPLSLGVTYEGLYRSFVSLIETKEAAYDISVALTFPIPVIGDQVFNHVFSGALPLLQLPKLSPGELKLSNIDFTGAEIAFGVNVENPNGFAIPFPDLEWDYDVNGVSLLRSSFSGGGQIAAGAAGLALISVSVKYADVFRALGSAVSSGSAKTNLSLGTGIDIPAFSGLKSGLDIPFDLPVLRMPEVSFQGIERRSMSLSAIEFSVNWEIDNRNSFEMDIAEFNYDFSVNNHRWARGRMEDPPKIRANGRTLIPLTVNVSAASVVLELANIISRGTAVTYNCAGNMSLQGGLPGLKLDLPLDLNGSTRIRQ